MTFALRFFEFLPHSFHLRLPELLKVFTKPVDWTVLLMSEAERAPG